MKNRIVRGYEVSYKRAGKKCSLLRSTKAEVNELEHRLKNVDRRKLLGTRQVQLMEVA